MNLRARNAFIVVLAALFSLYFFYEAKNLLFGFSVAIIYPEDGTAFDETEIEVAGKVTGASRIFLNGHPVFTNDQGFFTEKLMLAPGINLIELSATDKFGKRMADRRSVVLK